ncbi:hypothetical protein [Muriicola sp. Z0-33]|uniref:hypothetical protein n=1 Tax=Muriicola sp. Z0-33 TaxID=2816957 RepID=UPI0022387E27|nr:hypothetical protein [Muriicola sp. Z0-33]MCW5517563.1 hypothetical protein [Muriicola sp. Z0-33]
MKKNKYVLTGFTALLLLCSSGVIAQDEEAPSRPKYVAVTTIHWNMDNPNFNMDTWKAVEKEYYDKVTAKNDLIMSSGLYMHRFTPDNRELLAVNSYASWEAIEEAKKRTGELVKEGWPDEEERKAYFQKRNAYYSDFHSDEIYSTMKHAKPYGGGDAEILLLRTSHFKFPQDGSGEEFMATFKEYAENVLHKNEYIQGYYPNSHFYGADGTEFVEAFYVNSMADLDNLYDKNDELFNAHWSTDEGKKKMGEMRNKYFTGLHGEAIYTRVPELAKY